MLDEVIFSVKTDKSHDLQYLDELVPTSKHYSRQGPSTKYESYTGSWEPANDPDAIYIKIDDDVVSYLVVNRQCMNDQCGKGADLIYRFSSKMVQLRPWLTGWRRTPNISPSPRM